MGISETFRMAATKALETFRDESADEYISFPHTLTPHERKFVHDMCGDLGLQSKSHGKGQARQLRVSDESRLSQAMQRWHGTSLAAKHCLR